MVNQQTREAAFMQQQVAAASALSSDTQSIASKPQLQPPATSSTGDILFKWMATMYIQSTT
jgi:hypothetical protein